MKKNFIIIFIFVLFLLFVFLSYYFERVTTMKVIWSKKTQYVYFNRKLTIEEFKHFDYATTYDDMVKKVGTPNGRWGYGVGFPYYELSNGKIVVCGFLSPDEILFIQVGTKNISEYSLLPWKLPIKSENQKKTELTFVQSYEINKLLEMLKIKDWVKQSEPLGIYTKEGFKQYTEKGLEVDISYYFGNYQEEPTLPLLQIFQIFEDKVQTQFGFEVWDGEGSFAKGCYFLKGCEQVLDVSIQDTDLSIIELGEAKFSNSIMEFLLSRKEINKGLDAWVIFWGANENGKYMCLFVTSPLKRDWGINMSNKLCYSYYVTLDTKDNEVNAVSVKWLKRIK